MPYNESPSLSWPMDTALDARFNSHMLLDYPIQSQCILALTNMHQKKWNGRVGFGENGRTKIRFEALVNRKGARYAKAHHDEDCGTWIYWERGGVQVREGEENLKYYLVSL